jgi:GT2 family glycosyltransferase
MFRLMQRLRLRSRNRSSYRDWAARHAPSARDLERMRDESTQFPYQPLVSIVTPVFNTDPRWLRACIESVRAQAYRNWELCLCDDASTSTETRKVIDEYAAEPQIRVVRLEKNSHISAASNAALALATGEFVGLLDHDDELTPDALFEVVALLNGQPDADIVYSDEDKRDADGGLSDPYFKPDWSPEHLLSAMYACHFLVVRRDLFAQVGAFRLGFEGSQDHDLMLRLSEATSRIHHLPKVLYHWRRTPISTANIGTEKPWAHEAGMRALRDAVQRRQYAAMVVTGGVPGLYRVRFDVRDAPTVSVIIVNTLGSAGAGERCAARLRSLTSTIDIEVVIASGDRAVTQAVQRAVSAASGTHLVFLEASLVPLDAEWARALLEYSQQDAVGAVGARIEYADGTLRHIGLVLGVAPGVAPPMDGAEGHSYGYFSSAIGVRNYSAVSQECFMTRRSVFDDIGGLADNLPWRAAGVDYCLRARRRGLRVVFTPYARLRLTEEVNNSPLDAEAIDALRRRWGSALDADPYYNRNLSRREAYALGDGS